MKNFGIIFILALASNLAFSISFKECFAWTKRIDPALATLRPFLKGPAKNWYQESIVIPKEEIDPFFIEFARLRGGQLTLAGGSDLIEVGLLRSEKLASIGEVNLLMDRSLYKALEKNIEKMWGDVEVTVPAWGKRPALDKRSVSYNAEPGINLLAMTEAAKENVNVAVKYPFMAVPFKHGHVVTLNETGEARLYFRTPKDKENYSKKILTLPEEHFPNDWHLKTDAKRVVSNLVYSLAVYLRAKPKGWRFSDQSKSHLLSWVHFIKTDPELLGDLRSLLESRIQHQSIPSSVAKDVFQEFEIE